MPILFQKDFHKSFCSLNDKCGKALNLIYRKPRQEIPHLVFSFSSTKIIRFSTISRATSLMYSSKLCLGIIFCKPRTVHKNQLQANYRYSVLLAMSNPQERVAVIISSFHGLKDSVIFQNNKCTSNLNASFCHKDTHVYGNAVYNSVREAAREVKETGLDY